MKRKLSRNFRYFTYFLEALIAAAMLFAAYNFLLPLGPKEKTLYFQTTHTDSVLMTLQENGYNITDLDHFFLSENLLPKKGWYRILNTDDGRLSFFRELGKHPAKTMEVKVFSGETNEEMLRRLANDTKLDLEALKRQMQKEDRTGEGKLFAGIYRIARSADEKAVMDYLFMHTRHMIERFKTLFHRSDLEEKTIHRLRIIASIIERETNAPDEILLVSSVIHNRLKKKMKLQMDGTLNYGKYSHQIVTPTRIKNDTTAYNTYHHKGLPPAPLCTVSIEAFYAALFPQKSDYLFFMLGKDGRHIFSKTYKEHLAALKAFRKHQKASEIAKRETRETDISKL